MPIECIPNTDAVCNCGWLQLDNGIGGVFIVSNTARELKLERSHLYKKMKALGINPREDS